MSQPERLQVACTRSARLPRNRPTYGTGTLCAADAGREKRTTDCFLILYLTRLFPHTLTSISKYVRWLTPGGSPGEKN